jgi:hypothetical protein
MVLQLFGTFRNYLFHFKFTLQKNAYENFYPNDQYKGTDHCHELLPVIRVCAGHIGPWKGI